METCIHGDRVYREGNGEKGSWKAWFCGTPKGTPDQCKPIWIKDDPQPRATGQTDTSSAFLVPHVAEQLKGIREALERLTSIVESYVNR